MRAAFKAVQDGKQVAVALTRQAHGARLPAFRPTFKKRFAQFPIHDWGNDFSASAPACRRSRRDIASSALPTAVSTFSSAPHRLLSKDLKFSGSRPARRRRRAALRRAPQGTAQTNAQGNRCKPAMSATPIRSHRCSMSLVGLRDMSRKSSRHRPKTAWPFQTVVCEVRRENHSLVRSRSGAGAERPGVFCRTTAWSQSTKLHRASRGIGACGASCCCAWLQMSEKTKSRKR